MFAGIVEALGRIARVERRGADLRVSVEVDGGFAGQLRRGDSVMVSGVCLTAIELDGVSFTVFVSAETLACTTLGNWNEGEMVNLERALRVGGRIDGHFVSGHVDAVGRIGARTTDALSERFEIEASPSLAVLVVVKGSICVDGVSLTVNDVSDTKFSVNIIPYTLENTTFSLRQPGDAVNLEADLIARYIARHFGFLG